MTPINQLRQTLISLLAFFIIGAAASSADEASIKSFLQDHCFNCHGTQKQKADRRVDELSFDLTNDDTLGQWQDILDQLNLGDMPPASEPRPNQDRLKKLIADLTKKIQSAQAANQNRNTETVLRRLNRREYLNSIRDLFGFDMTMFDPTIGFPDDATHDGLDNQGETLVTSSYLLENYLDAAEKIVEKAIAFGPEPPSRLIKMRPPFDRTTNAHSGWVTQERRRTGEFQSIFQGTKERFGYRPLDDIAAGVDHDGFYKVRVKACGLHRQHNYPQHLIGTDQQEPIRLALVSGSQQFGTLHLRQSIEKTLAVMDLPDNTPAWQETTIWLDKGFQPRLTYQNGPYFFKALPSQLHKKFPKQFPIKLVFSNWWEVCQNIKTPQIRVHNVEIEGPFFAQWPPQSHQSIFGNASFDPAKTEKYIEDFATRAFRRPATPAELESLWSLLQLRLSEGDTPLDALKAGLTSVLCSPGFLYLEDATKKGSNQLDDHAIASRLSYFLWSTMPDEQLLQLAKQKKLSNPDVIKQQTLRMLKDDRANSFAGDFAERWLTLYKLGEMPPDNRDFQHYYVGELESAMRTETRLFTQHLLDENLDISNFLDSDFTFVNRPLVHHYKYDLAEFENQLVRQNQSAISTDISGLDSKKHRPTSSANSFVKLSTNTPKRGGLLGQASVLTVTANGIDTSPVIRGIWVLDNILGTSTPPPPEGIEPLEPDTRGAVSIREQLKKHRQVSSCNECHQKIDPLGFALEEFDATGGQRTHYATRSRKLKIDTSGKLPDGHSFQNIAELKSILLSRKQQFAKCLTEKMLSYALGRPLNVRDRPNVDKIVASLKANPGMRDLVLQVVQSEIFRKP